MKKKDIFVSAQGNEYTFKKLPDGKLWIDGYLREKVDGAVRNETYNCYMYTWEQALKAVPASLRLPTARDFMELCLELGYLEDSEDNVTERLVQKCGFKLTGRVNLVDFSLVSRNESLYVWSSTPCSTLPTNHYSYCLNASIGYVDPAYGYDQSGMFAVRCIKD